MRYKEFLSLNFSSPLSEPGGPVENYVTRLVRLNLLLLEGEFKVVF